MTKKERVLKLRELLDKAYPDVKCSLNYTTPLEMLIATQMSAQCTDARVNMVTPALFEKYKCAEDFANANVEDVEELIKSCGLYKTKAKSLVAMGKALTEQYNGVVPDTLEELIKLPGIGRKTANLVMGDIFGKPAVVVDTHCIRITRRLGLHNEKDPKKIEFILRDLLPPEESNDFCHRIVLHGRKTCDARKPKCEQCCMKDFCKKNI